MFFFYQIWLLCRWERWYRSIKWRSCNMKCCWPDVAHCSTQLLLLVAVVAIMAQMKQIFAVNNLMRLSPPPAPPPFSADYAPQSTAAAATTRTATSAVLLLHFIISAILSFAFYFSFNAINLALVWFSVSVSLWLSICLSVVCLYIYLPFSRTDIGWQYFPPFSAMSSGPAALWPANAVFISFSWPRFILLLLELSIKIARRRGLLRAKERGQLWRRKRQRMGIWAASPAEAVCLINSPLNCD